MTYHKAPYKYPTQFCKEPYTGSKLSHAKGVTLWTILCLTTLTLDFEQTQSYYLWLKPVGHCQIMNSRERGKSYISRSVVATSSLWRRGGSSTQLDRAGRGRMTIVSVLRRWMCRSRMGRRRRRTHGLLDWRQWLWLGSWLGRCWRFARIGGGGGGSHAAMHALIEDWIPMTEQ